MFSYTGLSAEQCDRLKEEFGVYLVRSGRMCVAGLNTHVTLRQLQTILYCAVLIANPALTQCES